MKALSNGSVLAVVAGAAMVMPASALASPVVGSPDTATAYPAIARPGTTPCVVTLFSDIRFADFDPKEFAYAPPAGCRGRWGKVVLEADFAVTAGRQFDRTGTIWIGGANLYFGTTMEPSRTVARTWRVERDVTEYGSLLREAQDGKVVLFNVVNETYTGILTGSARLVFYPQGRRDRAPEVADVVVPFSEQADGGTVLLAASTDRLARTVTLPRNVGAAYLDVVSQSQGPDEFWYACVPDDLATPTQSCGGTSFREAEVTIDGAIAGIAPIYPWLYTGAIDPYLWRPIPGVQTLSFDPYRVDLSPFAGLLSDGQPHEIAIRVAGANNYFMVTASLLVYLDAGARQVTGGILSNTFAPATPSFEDDIAVAEDGVVTGRVIARSDRAGALTGVVVGSRGPRLVTVWQRVVFDNQQIFDISAARYSQSIAQGTSTAAISVAVGGGADRFSLHTYVWPLALTYLYTTNEDGSATQETTVHEVWEQAALVAEPGRAPRLHRIEDVNAPRSVLTFDASGALVGTDNSSEHSYWVEDADACYSRAVYAVNGLVTAVEDGVECVAE